MDIDKDQKNEKNKTLIELIEILCELCKRNIDFIKTGQQQKFSFDLYLKYSTEIIQIADLINSFEMGRE